MLRMKSSTDRQIANQRDRLKHVRGGFPKAFARAAKRVAGQARTHISKEIRTHINVKAKDLKNQLKIDRKKDGASITLKESERLPLKYFGAVQNASGVKYRISKTGSRGFVPSAFIVNKLGGHAFLREGGKVKMTKGRHSGKMRQRIYKLMGASAWGAFVVKSMYKPTEKMIRSKFGERLKHEVDFLISKGTKRG